ncbi:MAG: mandelate racemase/muconate lactonizing enzyme family protein [Rhodospirillales bacterium]|nr:mandelate racemase/muconate lactonizing enzyme family protein [Rhodospirillales bacterium]
MTHDTTISRIRAYACEPAATPPIRFTGRDPLEHLTIEFLRLTLANGVEGIGSSTSGRLGTEPVVAAEIEAIADRVLGFDTANRSVLTDELLDEACPGPWKSLSILDCAMWDGYAQSVGTPLWRLLGGYRERIPTYASTEAFLTIEEYLDAARRFIAIGYPAIKFHMNTDVGVDLELIALITEIYGDGRVRFMTDHEQCCTFDEALRIGEAMSRGPFDWFEAPLTDTDLDAYVELNQAVDVDILCAGNILMGVNAWREGLACKAWSRLRFDASNSGGISNAIKAMGLARAYEVPVEIQSYGFAPAQFANLHVMLGMPGATWFEQPAPSEPYDVHITNPLAIDAHGCVAAPDGPGLGIAIDWYAVEAEATVTFDSAG